MGCGAIDITQGQFAVRLARLYLELSRVVESFSPVEAAVEAPFHGASARSALLLAHARGVVLAAVAQANIPVFEYSPAALKKAVTGNGRAEKEQVQAMVSRLIPGCAEIRSTDAADAVAAALGHLFTSGTGAGLRAPARAQR